MLNATNVGRYFLEKNSELSDIQIQKLVYYAYAGYMVKNNGIKLFDEKPQAWIHGPVFRSLFDSMKNQKKFLSNQEFLEFGESITKFLDKIYEVYGKYSGNELEKMTHSEIPWRKAREGLPPSQFSSRELSDKVIMEYYSN